MKKQILLVAIMSLLPTTAQLFAPPPSASKVIGGIVGLAIAGSCATLAKIKISSNASKPGKSNTVQGSQKMNNPKSTWGNSKGPGSR